MSQPISMINEPAAAHRIIFTVALYHKANGFSTHWEVSHQREGA
jgi:hypothetical protein